MQNNEICDILPPLPPPWEKCWTQKVLDDGTMALRPGFLLFSKEQLINYARLAVDQAAERRVMKEAHPDSYGHWDHKEISDLLHERDAQLERAEKAERKLAELKAGE